LAWQAELERAIADCNDHKTKTTRAIARNLANTEALIATMQELEDRN
jgi:hypothetical protein